jgi:hypothetical protein
MDLIVLFYACQNVPVMKALSFVMVLMFASIPMDMDIATTTTLALGSKELQERSKLAGSPPKAIGARRARHDVPSYQMTVLTGLYKVDIQEKSFFRLQKPLSESEEILLGGAIVRQTLDNWVPEQHLEAACNFADKSALAALLRGLGPLGPVRGFAAGPGGPLSRAARLVL